MKRFAKSDTIYIVAGVNFFDDECSERLRLPTLVDMAARCIMQGSASEAHVPRVSDATAGL
jgi:hypothetical protein